MGFHVGGALQDDGFAHAFAMYTNQSVQRCVCFSMWVRLAQRALHPHSPSYPLLRNNKPYEHSDPKLLYSTSSGPRGPPRFRPPCGRLVDLHCFISVGRAYGFSCLFFSGAR